MAKIKVESFVYFEHQNRDYILPHTHASYELVFYLSGSGEVSYRGEKHLYRSGTVSLLEPGLRHDETCIDPTKVYILTFSASGKLNIGTSFLHFEGETAAELTELLGKIGSEFRSDALYANRIADSLAEVVLYRLMREGKRQQHTKKVQDCVEAAKSYIKEHSSENIDFVVFSEQYGYSYHRFRHIFKEAAEVTLLTYLSEQRLSNAKELLENTTLTISEIAAKTGFSSQHYFIHFFSKHMGINPARYRQIFKGDNPIGVYRPNDTVNY